MIERPRQRTSATVYRIPKRDVIFSAQVLLQTGRPKIARSLPQELFLARKLVNFRFKVGHNGPEDALAWREGPDDDLVLALAIAAWKAERRLGLASSFGYSVSEFGAGRPSSIGPDAAERGERAPPRGVGARP